MTIKEALREAVVILKKANIEAPAVDAGVIMCYVLNCDRVHLHTCSDRVLTETEIGKFLESINKRAEGMPVSYITGYREFMSLDFKVTPDVLIPRPETEVLVECVIKYVNEFKSKENRAGETIRILDIGTGSGCIAVSLAYYIHDCLVTAVDVSEKALETARLNASNIGVADKIEFLRSDLFSELNREYSLQYKYDVIVSNPPYIPEAEIETLQIEVVEHEPLTALNGGSDGLYFYKRIIEESLVCLDANGVLALEVGYNQAGPVIELMGKNYYDIRAFKDLAGIERVVEGKKIP